jgi:hypothetical protein
VTHVWSEVCNSIHYNVKYVLFIMGSMITFLSKIWLYKMISTYIWKRDVTRLFSSLLLAIIPYHTPLFNLGSMLIWTTSDNELFLNDFCMFSYGSNGSSLFMSMSNLVWININILDMKRHMLISLFISMLVGREEEW